MKTKPDNSISLRPLVRDILRARPLSLKLLVAEMRRLDPNANEADVEAALEWNMKRGNVNFEHDNELEVDLWSLTTRGKAA